MKIESKPTIKEKLAQWQKSYAESFSIHGLSRIIYSGWKERVLWCLLFFSAVAGLGYMSSAIIENYYNKEVRTEVRIEQRESQQWPAITICPIMTLYKHFSCFKKRNMLGSINNWLCSKRFILPYASEKTYNSKLDLKDGCLVFNSNGTFKHQGGAPRGLDIEIRSTQDSVGNGGLALFFNDAKTIRNDEHVFYLYDIDLKFLRGSLKSGSHTFFLEATESEKLGSPYRSSCVKNQTLDVQHYSKYSYSACMDKCFALKIYEECRYVPGVFESYITKAPYESPLDEEESFRCYEVIVASYFYNASFLSDCFCGQPCKHKYYTVTHEQELYSDSQSEMLWHLQVRFKSNMVNVVKEHPQYSTEELLSNVGGLCGLFLGMSILSLAEIMIYAGISFVRCFF